MPEDLESLLSSLAPGGRDFERLCAWLLQNAPEYRSKVKRVWSWDEWPGRWGADAGIDLVAETHDGKLWAVQAKHYAPAYAIRKADLDSFLSESARSQFSYRLLIATTDHLGATARRTIGGQEKPVGVLLRTALDATTLTFRHAVTVLAYTGLRVSELCGLTWEDVDLIDKVVSVTKQLAPLRRGEEPERVKLKSRASLREVPLLDRAYEALVAQLEIEQAKGLGSESDFCFTSQTGRPLGRDRLSKRGVAAAARKAGIGKVTAQALRRSAATATAQARVPVVIAAAMTRHSPQVYDACYAKPFRDAEERDRVRSSLASIGFGNASVDQPVDQEAIS